MSNMEINQVLAQMRVMANSAEGTGTSLETKASGFADLLKESIDQVNEAQSKSREMSNAFEAGDPEVGLAEVMVTMQKASISFEAVSQVRNQLLNAYQDVMNMPV